jgi:L-ascorbate metabolism protein UlaG (beta-lactamase superfamily)
MAQHDPHQTMSILAVGGATVVFNYGGLRFITDPTFDPPGEQPRGLVKVNGPAVEPDSVRPIDVVLLSHDHHPDNLDAAGRAFLGRAARVLTTAEGAERLVGDAVGMQPWATHDLERPQGGVLTVTAVPALHGPEGCDPVMGPVIGFVLTAEDLPSLYVSGDNASTDVVREIVERLGHADLAILFAGAASLPQRLDGAYLTLTSDGAVEATRILRARAVVPAHFHGWAHFTQDADHLRTAFAAAGLSDALVLAEPGQEVTVSLATATAPE